LAVVEGLHPAFIPRRRTEEPGRHAACCRSVTTWARGRALPGVGVPQDRLRSLHIDPGGDEARGRRLPQVVEPEAHVPPAARRLVLDHLAQARGDRRRVPDPAQPVRVPQGPPPGALNSSAPLVCMSPCRLLTTWKPSTTLRRCGQLARPQHLDSVVRTSALGGVTANFRLWLQTFSWHYGTPD